MPPVLRQSSFRNPEHAARSVIDILVSVLYLVIARRCLLARQTSRSQSSQSHAPSATSASMPPSWAARNAATPPGAMPAKVSDIERATVTAGFAKDVEAVNQYAEVM